MSSVVGALTGGVAGIAIGEAGSVALDPVFEPVKQDAWKRKPSKILEAPELATLVAQALNAVSDVLDDVERNGYASDEFQSLVQLALKAPGVPEAEKLYLRRNADPAGSITLAQLHHAYGKAAIEGQYWTALQAAAETTLLTPAELALGVVRGTVPDAGLMVVTLDTGDSNVPKYTPAALNTLNEAQAAGFNEERMRALVGSIGLPMSTHEAASAYFRGIITRGAFNQSILEGDVRPEWAPFILEQAREILTAHDWVELHLRGYITDTQMYAGTALRGMSTADTDRLFLVTGRPLAVHQITTGLARGGVFQPEPGEIQDPFEAAVHEANIKPSYYDLAIANKYTLPSAFVLKALATAGDLTQDETNTLLLQIGWPPDLALKVSTVWTAAKTGGTNKHVVSSTTSLVTAARKAYVGRAADQAQAAQALTAAQIDPGTQAQLFTLWDAQRTLEALPAPPAA